MKKLLTVVIFSVLSLSAIANDSKWVNLSSGDMGSVAIMPSSYAEDALGFRTIWVRAEFKHPKNNIYKTDILYRVDCPARKLGGVHLISYNKQGKVIEDFEVPEYLADMRTVPPDGLNYEILEGLCAMP